MEIHDLDVTEDSLQKLSKEDIWNKYQNEINQIKRENEDLHIKEKMWEKKYIDQKSVYEHSEKQELLKKNKELQEAESVINHQKEKINLLNIQQKDEVDALHKKLQSNKCALDAMKKTLDNEKAFRICADEEIKNLKEQIKCNTIKYKSLENENEKLINEKLKIEEAKTKINQQCNELIQKNISLENHCEKKDLEFDKQVCLINELENIVIELKEKINNYAETEEENNKLAKQLTLCSKQMEAYENEREVYVQRLQKIQKEDNELQYIIKDLKKEVDVKNSKINYLNEYISDLNSNNSILSTNINILQINCTNCLKLLDEIVDNYINNQIKLNKGVNNEESSMLRSLLNETFELFERSLTEYKLLKSSYKDSEFTLKSDINNKENIIKSLQNKLKEYKQEVIKNGSSNIHISDTKNVTKDLHFKQISNDEFEKQLTYINIIKVDLLPKQKLLISECKEFLLNKVKEIETLISSKNEYIKNVHIINENLKKKNDEKNTIIIELKTQILKLEKIITEQDASFKDMEIEIQYLKDNCDNSSTTSISKADEINRLHEIDESQEDRAQKLKAIAIKQKKQIADLKQSIENEIRKHNLEKNDLINKLTTLAEQGKLARCLQEQYDIKCDEFDIKCNEIKELVKKHKEEENQLLEQTKLCTNLKSNIETLNEDLNHAKKTINSLKEVQKDLNSKIEVYKQEKTANEILKTNREAHIKELTLNLKVSKDKVKLMESELDKLKTEKQKINIRDLELNSYEKTLDELSQKIKDEKLHTQNLEQELSSANNVIDSLHEQIKHLEYTVTTEQERNKQNINKIESCRTGLNNAESLLNEKEKKLIECVEDLNREKSLHINITNKYDELQTQYETEKENYQMQHFQLNEKVRKLQVELNIANDNISKYMEENKSLLDEFESYKVKAHSVFQKHKQYSVNNIKITELNEQLQDATKVLNITKTNVQNLSSELSIKNTEISMLQNEIDKYEKKLNNITKTLLTKDKEIYCLNTEIENIKFILEKEKASFNNTISSERIIHKNEIEKLQQEITLAKEDKKTTELKVELSTEENKIKKSNSLNHIHDDDEMFSDFASSSESVRKISKSALMPLEDLLLFDNNSISDPISELNTTNKQLKQLTMMLNDAEKNCSRYEQQNKFLKEDIRRLQRSVDRHAEIQNMEYLKNIILKFVTLSSGVEKCHLVPVINKLLKLSPDEHKQIETIAKGSYSDQNSSWSNLFTWSQGT